MIRALALVLLPTLVLAQGAPRTPNLRLKYGGDATTNDNFVKLDDCFGTTLDRCITRLRLGGQRTPDGILTVYNTDTALHTLAVLSDNGTGGALRRFEVENTVGSRIDINFRNATVNFGGDTTDTEPTGGTQAFFFSPTGTSSYDAIRLYYPGEGSSGSKTLVVNTNGYITSFGRGKASQIFKICDYTDQSAANCRFVLNEDGNLSWGGGTSQDVTLARVAAKVAGISAGQAFRLSGPSDTPPTCAASTEGAVYYDDSLNELCFCVSATWCKVSDPATCGTNTSCG